MSGNATIMATHQIKIITTIGDQLIPYIMGINTFRPNQAGAMKIGSIATVTIGTTGQETIMTTGRAGLRISKAIGNMTMIISQGSDKMTVATLGSLILAISQIARRNREITQITVISTRTGMAIGKNRQAIETIGGSLNNPWRTHPLFRSKIQ
jgi:hypothetical protein